jgi:hypothetical protein
MLNTQTFDDVVKSNPETVRNEISKALSDSIQFSKIDEFPNYRGLYFLYLSDGNILLYIGSA